MRHLPVWLQCLAGAAFGAAGYWASSGISALSGPFCWRVSSSATLRVQRVRTARLEKTRLGFVIGAPAIGHPIPKERALVDDFLLFLLILAVVLIAVWRNVRLVRRFRERRKSNVS